MRDADVGMVGCSCNRAPAKINAGAKRVRNRTTTLCNHSSFLVGISHHLRHFIAEIGVEHTHTETTRKPRARTPQTDSLNGGGGGGGGGSTPSQSKQSAQNDSWFWSAAAREDPSRGPGDDFPTTPPAPPRPPPPLPPREGDAPVLNAPPPGW
ncbi:unnamed protein product [Ectocarpus sp. 12 AP-2014]